MRTLSGSIWSMMAALVICGPSFAADKAGSIIWRNGVVNNAVQSADDVAGELANLAARPDARHVMVQFDRPMLDDQKARLSAGGIELLSYLGNNAYFSSLSPAGLNATAAAGPSVLVYASAIDLPMKMHPMFLRGDIPDYAIVADRDSADPIVAAYIIFHPDVPLSKGFDLMDDLGVLVRSELSSINGLVIEFRLSVLEKIARDDRVQWIEPPLPQMTECNNSNRARTGADTAQAAPYNLNGNGVVVLIFDAGTASANHPDFQGRLTVRDNSGTLGHSTHVSGTVGGAGVVNPLYKGMAPACTLFSYGFQWMSGSQFLYSDPGDLQADYTAAINNDHCTIANNSIGSNTSVNGFPCSNQGNYGITDQLIDGIVRGSVSGGAPFRIVWAAGNERQSSRCNDETFCTGQPGGCGEFYNIAPPATAKNHITVGALNSNDDSMTTFSSWGPCDDGRLKPDIAGPGCQSNDDSGVTSTTGSNGYSSLCGTSMASPTVCGLSALVLQDYRAHFAGPDPRNSTLKILWAHNAVDLGNPGPDNKYGYGSVRVIPTIDFMRTGNFGEDQLIAGETRPYIVNVPAGTPQLKVTVAWDDPPGTPNVVPALINDLDVRVFDPNNVQYFPWTLDPTHPNNNAVQTTRNSVDNMEQVLVNNPIAGTWHVEVFGFNVPQGPQPFSICASPFLAAGAGCEEVPVAVTGVQASDGTSCTTIRVTWDAVDGATSYSVSRSTTNDVATAAYVGASITSPFDDVNASQGATYYYWVAALNHCGRGPLSAQSDSGSLSNIGPPPPTDVSATDGTSCVNTVVSWTASLGASDYQIFRSTSNDFATATQIGARGAPNTTYTDLSGMIRTNYYYWVRASNVCGVSTVAGPDVGYREGLPVSPVITASDGAFCNSVLISWPPASGATTYTVLRSLTNDFYSATPLGTVSGLSLRDNIVANGITYYYWAISTNTCGNSQASAFDTGTSGHNPPSVPTNVSASDGSSDTAVNVSWTAATDVLTYLVWRNTVNNPATATQVGSATDTTFADTSAAQGTIYYYWVSAFNLCGNSALSASSDSGFRYLVPATKHGQRFP